MAGMIHNKRGTVLGDWITITIVFGLLCLTNCANAETWKEKYQQDRIEWRIAELEKYSHLSCHDESRIEELEERIEVLESHILRIRKRLLEASEE